LKPLIRRTVILVFLVLICFSFESLAHGEDWLPISQEELTMTQEPKAPGAAAVYLYRQVDGDDTNGEVNIYVRLKILTEEGRKYADVEIPFVKGVEYVRAIEARTIRPDGSIVRFDGTVYDKPVANAHGKKLVTKTFTMPEAGVGSIVEYRYRFQQQAGFVFNSHWILSQELFTRYARFSQVPSPYFTMQWSWPRGLPPNTTTPVKERGKIRLEAHDVPAFVTEELMPPEDELKFRVDFIYLSEDQPADQDPARFWKHFNKQEFSTLKHFINEPKPLAHALEQMVAGSDTPEIKLRKIYARVQQLRNTSFEREKSEQELKRDKLPEAHDVGDVLDHGGGDAFVLTDLFLALARTAGFQADLVLIPTRDRYFFSPNMMNPRELNSSVVMVSLDGQTRYLEPGVPFTPFGLLPWYETGVQGLRIDDKDGSWVKIPLPPASDSRTERKAQLKLEDGALKGDVTVRFTGLDAALRRLEERNEDDTDRRQFLEDDLKRSVPTGMKVTLTNQPDWTSIEDPLVVTYQVEIPGWAAAAGRRQLLKAGLFSNEDDHTFQHATRHHPMYFDFPYRHSDDVTIEMPPGLQIGSLPKPQAADLKFFTYSLSAENSQGALHLKRDVMLDALMVDPKFYDQLRDFFQSVRSGDEEQVVVVPQAAVTKR
jgi:hypothetical protein